MSEPAAPELTPVAAGGRLAGIDLVRGLVMVLMALDHTRDFFGDPRIDPTDVATTTPALFATRWITHLCAPTFVLLAGTAAHLWGARHERTRGDLSRFLLLRGLWLIVLEFTLVGAAWIWDVALVFHLIGVIGAIGVGFLVLAGLIWLPRPVLVAAGLAIVVGHNLLDPVTLEDAGGLSWLWTLLHEGSPAGTITGGSHVVWVQYPLLPWIGVVALGYGLGPVFQLPESSRRRELLTLGAGVTLLFLVLRATNVYGDPQPWTRWASPVQTIESFLNCAKYPPSLLYLGMTLGPVLLLLAVADRWRGPVARILIVFGRVPLFYYLVHLYVLAGASGLWYLATSGRFAPAMRTLIASSGPGGAVLPENFGNGNQLGLVYSAWFLLVALLYPLCRAYGERKRRGTSALWTYL